VRAKEEEEFSPHDELLLEDFIRVVVVETLRSVERNVRLLDLQQLPQTLLALTYHHRDAFSFFESAKSTLREALDCERVNLFLVDPEQQTVRLDQGLGYSDEVAQLEAQVRAAEKAAEEESERRELKLKLGHARRMQEELQGTFVSFPIGQGVAGRAATRQGVTNFSSVEHEKLQEVEKVSILGKPCRNMLCCRAVDGCERVVAVVQAINKRAGVFSQADASLLASLSPQLAASVAEAAHAQQLEHGRSRFMDLSRMAVDSLACLDETSLCELVLSWGPRVTGAHTCKLWVYDSKEGLLASSSASHGRRSLSLDEHSATAIGQAALSGERQLGQVEGGRRVQYEPVKSGTRTVGVLELRMSRSTESEDEKEAVEILIRMIANALERLSPTET